MESSEREIARLKEEISKFEKDLKWYKATYEDRSIAGIIKSKILSEKKKNTLFNKSRFKFKSFRNFFKGSFLKHSNKFLREPNVAKLSKEIVCTIVNHNCNENALRLKKNLSRYFDTIIFDSGSKIIDKNFVELGNVYYSGLLNHSYEFAKENKYKYMLFICSDVVIENDEIDKMIVNLSTMDMSKVGVYSPSSSGRSHAYCKRQNNHGLRSVPFVEGFIFLANMDIMDELCPIDVKINLYGWGLDVTKGYLCRKKNLLCLIDDKVNVYHPVETGYSPSSAERDMWQWVESFNDIKFKKFYEKQIDVIRRGHAGLNKVSVIIPCYNQASYLEETIHSVLMQEHGNIEILLINDGSTDFTDAIGKKYSEIYANIKYISKPNGGLGQTRNVGLKSISGDFIQFLDSDDLLSSDKIFEQIYDFILDPEIQVSYSEYLCFNDGNKEDTWKYSRLILNEDPVLDLIQNWETELSIPVHCFLLRKSVVQDVFFDEELPNHEDWEFHLQIAAKKPKYKYESHGIAYYRVRQTSMSRDRELMTKGKKMCIKKAIDSNKFQGEHLSELHIRLNQD